MADEVTRRVLQLIDYLGAYDALRNPPVRDIAAAGAFVLAGPDLPADDGIRLTPGGESWLTVDFVALPPRPEIPPHLSGILVGSAGADPDTAPTLAGSAAPEGADGADGPDAELRAEAADWLAERWEPWADRYRSARQVKELYRDLFEQRELLASDRDAYELVWGFGRIRHTAAARPGEKRARIDHSVVTVQAEIDADLASGRLSVRPVGPPTVETLYLAGLEIDDRIGFSALGRDVAETDAPVEVWDDRARRDLLRGLLRTIDQDGAIVGESEVQPGRSVLEDTWVLHVRRRRPDYQGFLDELRRHYRDGSEPPDPLKAIVVDRPSTLIPPDGDGEDGDRLLLPLPFNAEQERIVALASERPGVTVQGPPGTGKSHTIANIISHYVANGQRVLVVAEKEQALRVLADKIPPGIRDLTVSVLGADDEGRRRLESSITQIQSRVAGLDRDHADRRIARTERRLAELDAEAADLDALLLAVRQAEIQPCPGTWEAGTDPTPATVAAWLAANEDDLGIIDDEIPLDRTPPLDPAAYRELVDLLDVVEPGDLTACASIRPDPDLLPTVGELERLFAAESEISERLDAIGSERFGTVSWETVEGLPANRSTEIRDALANELDWRRKHAGSWVERVREEAVDDLLREQWVTFADECDKLRHHILGRAQLIEAHTIECEDGIGPIVADELKAIGRRLFEKGRLGIGPAASRRRSTLALFRIDGRAPSTPDEIDLCVARVEVDSARRTLSTRWRNRMDPISGPLLDQARPEATITLALEQLGRALEADRRWRDLRAQVERFGISAPTAVGPEDLGLLVEVFDVVAFRQQRHQAIEERRTLIDHLEQGRATPGASPLWGHLATALTRRDAEGWAEARGRVERLRSIEPDVAEFARLHDALAGAAPDWTRRLLGDPSARPGAERYGRAWEWARLDAWLRSIHDLGDPAALQRRIEEVADERRAVIENLVSLRAWRRLADRIGDRERQALNSYLQAVRRYGRTGGKFAARWLGQIRAALNDSKEAVPVWIMPTNRALASFRPDPEPRFDVLVVDEASQLGHEALPLLALARTTIVVGDDKQTSPENVGLQREPVFGLIEQYLGDIPAAATLFDPDASLYDLAYQKFPDVIMLTEHFRSLPEIIRFSNEHAYDDLIVPLRDRLPTPGWRQVGAVHVPDAVRTGDLNRGEAEAVVEILVSAAADPDYDGMSFGVISLLGSSQSGYIWRRLFDELGPEEMRRRRIRCGEPASFQGDERDVIVISTVVSLDPADPSARVGAMTNRAAERRMNVAASRARNQMWVVHSLPADRFPPHDLRGDLIRHAAGGGGADPAGPDLLDDPGRRVAAEDSRCRTPLQRAVLDAVRARGHERVRVGHTVGRHEIDLVIEGAEGRLAVSCDSDSWPGEEAWRLGYERQRVLERAGWTFVRVRASAFNRDRDRALAPLWEQLQRLGIGPEAALSAATVPGIGSRGLAAADRPRWRRELPGGDEDRAPVESRRQKRRASAGGPRDDAPVEEAPPKRPARPAPAGPELPPYTAWVPWKVAPVDRGTAAEIIDGLVDIVEVEGPVLVERVVAIYLPASGARRATAVTRAELAAVIDAAVADGQLTVVDDGTIGTDRTLHLPGSPGVQVRQLGPRTFDEVPGSEVHRLLADLDVLDRPAEAGRAVRKMLGLPRLTPRMAARLESCAEEIWRIDP